MSFKTSLKKTDLDLSNNALFKEKITETFIDRDTAYSLLLQ